jgi:hypothetical protein
MKKLLFLDIDGVLHPNFSQEGEYFSRASYLVDALDADAFLIRDWHLTKAARVEYTHGYCTWISYALGVVLRALGIWCASSYRWRSRSIQG